MEDIKPKLDENEIVETKAGPEGNSDAALELEKQKTAEGVAHFHRLGWKRLTVVLIVQSIALGSLGLPAAFATLGMVTGVICCLGLGVIAIFASYMIGLVILKYPEVSHYADFGRLLLGSIGEKIFATVFVALLVLVVGSHCLTGSIAFVTITGSGICSLVFGVVSAIILLLLAIPPSFTEVAILGYVDFVSIIAAIGLTMISTGIQSQGTSDSSWSAWPKENLSLAEAFVAVSNIVFAYAFAAAQPSFMDEMHTPKDFTKAISALGVAQIVVYTLTGALIYSFVGRNVQSPALLSAGSLQAKVAFGLALPVIFISGSINTTVACRYVHGLMYRDTVTRYVNTKKGWVTWLSLVTIVTLLAWITAEAIPFFSELLAVCGALFVSGFSFYIPPVLWFFLLKEGNWYAKKNLRMALCNFVVFAVGILVLGIGTYSSIEQIIFKFRHGDVNRPFACDVER